MDTLRSSGRRVALLAVTAALALAAIGAFASGAGALSSRFVVNDGDVYTRGPKIAAGDAGYSPFFRPAVVVWDGGSIIAGHGASAGYKFPEATLTMVPRVCTSYVSSTGGANVAAMLAEAPVEVDARYLANADLNVCVVLAGGGDFRDGYTAADIYATLRTYCAGRRAAGFRVVVVTVLPCHDPVTFEALRLAYDAMVRDTWEEFADGLADIAADARIGDTGDNFDRQFYAQDARHLNNAGNAVMASVAAPTLNALPWLSARCEMRVRDAAGEWGDWLPYAGSKTAMLIDYDGQHVVEAEYRMDGGAAVAVSDEIFLDTVRPEPVALRAVTVRRGRKATLRYRVDDAEPCGPEANAYVAVTTAGGRVIKQFSRRRVLVGQAASVVFTCRLPKGSYRYVVSARDAAGNPQDVAGSARLVVR